MEQAITPGQLRCIKTLMGKLKLQAQKDDIVAGFTMQRSTHVSQMHLPEAIDLIKYLKAQDPEEIKAEVMRRKIMWMAHEIGYELPSTHKIDMKRLDGWCVEKGYLHKKLNQYRYAELPLLVTQFEKVYKWFLNSI